MITFAKRFQTLYVIRRISSTTLFHTFRSGVMGRAEFKARCPFGEVVEVGRSAFDYWRTDSEKFLDVRDASIVTNDEEVYMRCIIYCALRPHAGDPYGLARLVVKMPELPTLYWQGLIRWAYIHDKQALRRIIKSLKILYVL